MIVGLVITLYLSNRVRKSSCLGSKLSLHDVNVPVFVGCCIHYDLQICESTGLRGWVFEEGKVLWMGLVKFDQSYHLRLNTYVYNIYICIVEFHILHSVSTCGYILYIYTHVCRYVYIYMYTHLCIYIMYITFSSSSYVYIVFAKLFENLLPQNPSVPTLVVIQMSQ